MDLLAGGERVPQPAAEGTQLAHRRRRVEVAGDVKALPPDITEELYLILREAVRNALRHAAPRRLDVTVDVAATEVRAVVSDDGRGFDPGGPDRTGGGLPSMRERTLLLRGRLAVVSEPGKGTRIEVQVPLMESGL